MCGEKGKDTFTGTGSQQSHSWAHTLRKSKLKKAHVPVFTAVLFATARTWRQPRCPSTVEWIEAVLYIYKGIILSHIKELTESILMRWVNLEPIIQSKVSQK